MLVKYYLAVGCCPSLLFPFVLKQTLHVFLLFKLDQIPAEPSAGIWVPARENPNAASPLRFFTQYGDGRLLAQLRRPSRRFVFFLPSLISASGVTRHMHFRGACPIPSLLRLAQPCRLLGRGRRHFWMEQAKNASPFPSACSSQHRE